MIFLKVFIFITIYFLITRFLIGIGLVYSNTIPSLKDWERGVREKKDHYDDPMPFVIWFLPVAGEFALIVLFFIAILSPIYLFTGYLLKQKEEKNKQDLIKKNIETKEKEIKDLQMKLIEEELDVELKKLKEKKYVTS